MILYGGDKYVMAALYIDHNSTTSGGKSQSEITGVHMEYAKLVKE